MYYGQNGNQTREIIDTAIFVYLPAWFLIVLLVGLLIITYYVWKLMRKVNHNSRRIRPARQSRRRR